MMTRLLKAVLISLTLTWSFASIAAPPIWDTEYGAAIGPLSDDDDESQDLGFMFPFDGVMYDSIAIGSNGGIMLGNGGTYVMSYTDYWAFSISDFEDYFTNAGNPAIFPFVSDFDPSDGGSIHFKTDGTMAVVTWNSVLTYSNNVDIGDFQATLSSDGSITFGYDLVVPAADLIAAFTGGIVVGVSDGMGAAVPVSSDLSAPVNADVSAKTTYEVWCGDENMVVAGECYAQDGSRPDNSAFDLDQTNVVLTPNATGGFDISGQAAPDPGPVAGEVLGNYGGCTVGVSDGSFDPTLPLLLLLSIVGLMTRRKV